MKILWRSLSAIVVCTFLISVFQSALAVSTIKYWHMNPLGQAIVKIDGKVRFLRPGQTSKEGVTLVSVNAKEIVVKLDNRRYRYLKGSDEGLLLKDEILIKKGENNSFVADCKVNGKSIKMIIDTGATVVFLNARDARRLGIKYRKRRDNKYQFESAQGVLGAYEAKIGSISIADISVKNVKAYVSADDHYPSMPLLGMTFLEHVTFVVSGESMLITP